jgi:hypothetical protein
LYSVALQIDGTATMDEVFASIVSAIDGAVSKVPEAASA